MGAFCSPPYMSATLPYRANADFLESKYADWKKDSGSVEPLWSSFFEGFELGMSQSNQLAAAGKEGAGQKLSEDEIEFRSKVTNAVLDFRRIGHTAAWLDPLSK